MKPEVDDGSLHASMSSLKTVSRVANIGSLQAHSVQAEPSLHGTGTRMDFLSENMSRCRCYCERGCELVGMISKNTRKSETVILSFCKFESKVMWNFMILFYFINCVKLQNIKFGGRASTI